ncbi:hypothetical protein N9Y31_00715 [Alphaproteobacteria bacterium]|nr:hypothetical protein [Alphaproteobacteria bacterium]
MPARLAKLIDAENEIRHHRVLPSIAKRCAKYRQPGLAHIESHC